MERYEFEIVVEGARDGGDDRCAVFVEGARAILALADGAGGVIGASRAAQALIDHVEDKRSRLHDAASCAALLATVDMELERDRDAGETTGIVAVIADGVVMGASVGDSAARILGPTRRQLLTRHRVDRTRLGRGDAVPMIFRGLLGADTLLLASDGLWDYARLDAVVRAVRQPSLGRVAHECLAAARLPSGALPDDVGLILVRDGGGRRRSSTRIPRGASRSSRGTANGAA